MDASKSHATPPLQQRQYGRYKSIDPLVMGEKKIYSSQADLKFELL